ncbi:MAG TPA: hypothetical protein VFL83_12325 [Anaeromyxobacter sp.]|nr:hypothetical protein [Anaeromyxobacter sp.]
MKASCASRPSLWQLLALAALCAAAPVARAAKAPDGTVVNPTGGLSLKIRDAQAPPGGALQAEVTLTQPKPILMGSSTLSFETTTGTLLGVSTVAPGAGVSDAFGTAVYRGGNVAVQVVSPSAVLGAVMGTPILTLTFGVPATTPRGTSGAITLDGLASLWLDPAGQPYQQVVKNGKFTIAGTLGITDVFPGGVLPAGATVVVSGVGFEPGAIVEIDGVAVATTFVSASEVHATLGAALDLFARSVRVRNPDRTIASYYAYLRGLWLAPTTANALLASTDPMFAQQAFTSASWASAAAAGQFLGVALQNATPAAADVVFELRDAAANVLASAPLRLPPYHRIWRDTAELFGAAPPANGFLVVRSSTAIEMVGVVGDPVAGTVVPMVPALAFP